MLLVAACTSGEKDVRDPDPVAAGPVVDSAPYLCDLVPERAFRLVSGVTKTQTAKTDGSNEDGECLTPGNSPHSLVVGWKQERPAVSRQYLTGVLDDWLAVYRRHDGVVLPVDLGEGMAVHMPEGPFGEQPYRVVAKFRCDGKERLVTLYLSQVAEGRDAMGDLIALMRIAQRRYGEVHGCVPGT
ncbi:hypothetical protein ACQP25_03675 [Microtetraspora malaysiensis]|uniref:hypothetical protein n=1 Tax=Microtetraspora malaysiensis TaxID=161358 RepID=UPI003D8F7590